MANTFSNLEATEIKARLTSLMQSNFLHSCSNNFVQTFLNSKAILLADELVIHALM